ncbi:hypothetical protein ACRAWD_06025 [Caulobacter segnis]
MLASTEALATKMFEEMKGRIKEDDASVPSKDGRTSRYYTRFEKGAQRDPRPQAIRRRDRGGPAGRGGRRSKEQGLLPGRRRRLLARPQALRLGRRRAGARKSYPAYPASRTWRPVRCWRARSRAAPATSASRPTASGLFWTFRDDNGRPAKIYRRPARGAAPRTTC